jgi:GntR family transcriptional regulator
MNNIKHTQLARELAEGIATGRFPVGSLLPTEFELCKQYGTTRYTVRMALGALGDLGLISRRRNVGTRVEAERSEPAFVPSLASVEDLAQFGATHVRDVREVAHVVVDIALAQELGCPAGTRWTRISSLRMEGGKRKRPIGWTDVYVDASYADIGEMVRESPDMLISALIESRYGRRIARIRQDISATSLSRQMADALKVEANSPALKIVRRYLDAAEDAFEISVSVHPAGRFTFSMQLNRSKSGARAGRRH